jgi:hypothetical protein
MAGSVPVPMICFKSEWPMANGRLRDRPAHGRLEIGSQLFFDFNKSSARLRDRATTSQVGSSSNF